MINLQPTSAIEHFAVLSKCGFHHHHCQSQPQCFSCNNLFIWRNNGEFWYKWIHHCTWKIRVKPAGHRTVSGWALTTPAGHRTTSHGARPMFFIYRRRPAPVRYVTTIEKILKKRPGDYQIRRWCANHWNRTVSVLFVTIALSTYIGIQCLFIMPVKGLIGLESRWNSAPCAYRFTKGIESPIKHGYATQCLYSQLADKSPWHSGVCPDKTDLWSF